MCTLLVSMAMPTVQRRASTRVLLLLSALVMAAACAALLLEHAVAFVVLLLLFFAAYASSQASLFTAFNERYGTHPQSATFVGYISAAGSVGRCCGPLWASALYNCGHVADATPVWLINAGGVLLAAVGVAVAWRELERLGPP